MRFKYLIIASIVMLSISYNFVFGDDPKRLSINDIVQIYEARQAAIRSLRFSADIEVVSYVSDPPPFCAGDKSTRFSFKEFAATNSKRYLHQSFGPDRFAYSNSKLERWDGSIYSVYFDKIKSGFINNFFMQDGHLPNQVFHVEFSPLGQTMISFGLDDPTGTATYLDELRNVHRRQFLSILDQTEKIGEADCIVLAHTYPNRPITPFLWLDSSHGYALKKSIVYFNAKDLTQIIYLNDLFEEPQPGVWCVKQGRKQYIGPSKSQPNDKTILTEQVIQFSNIRINDDEATSDSLFVKFFPPGTMGRSLIDHSTWVEGRSKL